MTLRASVILAALPAAAAPAQEPVFYREPDIHGDKVVFTAEGDLWLGDITAKAAIRLTSHEGFERDAQFSPDGTQIAFVGEYDGNRELYVMPATGGQPRRLTYTYDYAKMQDWAPDGKSIWFSSRSYPRSYGLFEIPVEGGFPQKKNLEFMSHASVGPENRLAITRKLRTYMNWFRYEGGMRNGIWVGTEQNGFTRIVEPRGGTNEYPTWTEKGIAFIHERDAKFSVMSVAPGGGRTRILAGPYDKEVREMDTDGTRLVYERGFGIEMLDLQTGEAQPLSFTLTSDLLHRRPYTVPAEKHATFASMSPTAKRVLVESRGQIISLPAKEGAAQVLMAEDGVRYQMPRLSPKGDKLAYVSDATGEQQLYVANADGTGEKMITSEGRRQLKAYTWSPDGAWICLYDSNMKLRLVKADGSDERVIGQGDNWYGMAHDWSPDSAYLAFAQPEDLTFQRFIHIHDISANKTRKLSDGLAHEDNPDFSPDGKWLAFTSRRNMTGTWDHTLNQYNFNQDPNVVLFLPLEKKTPSPWLPKNDAEPAKKPPAVGAPKKPETAKPATPTTKIDWEGLYARRIEAPIAPGGYGRLEFVPGKLLMQDGPAIKAFDLAKKSVSTVTNGALGGLSTDHKTLLVGNGPVIRLVPVASANAAPTVGKVDFHNLRLRIDPAAEWEQMYWDGWRLLRDYFYVKNMHGVDWNALGDKYAEYVPGLRSREDLDELFRWLMSELGNSHMYISPGDTRRKETPPTPAFLGVDLEAHSSGYYRIKRILKGDGYRQGERSPLAQHGLDVHEGDFLIEVAGRPAKIGTDFMGGLVGRSGKTIALKVSSAPRAAGARTVYVQPVASERRMRYLTWRQEMRDYVEEKSGGRIGYLHLSAMSAPDFQDFAKQFYPLRNKQALLIDTRFNNGGNVSHIINRILREQLAGYFNMRGSVGSWTRQGDFFAGPMAVVMNEFNVSNGEEFPDEFRKLGLGTIFGMQTMGGEVGSSPGWPLVDGGVLSVPNYGFWTEEGWQIEGPGVFPDVEVPSDPNAFLKGVDPQLDAAIAHLLEEVRKSPVVRPKQPADPDKTGGGGR